MGNQHNPSTSDIQDVSSNCISCLNMRQLSANSLESNHFFERHCQQNKCNDIVDIQLLDKRRAVFISVNGLYQTWNHCPSIVLYTALFVLPLKRDWIYRPHEHIDEIQSNCSFSNLYAYTHKQPPPESSQTTTFIQLLKWKDSQGLVFWMLDDYDVPSDCDSNELIHPFWYHFSEKLSNLYDPITGNKYKPLNLDHRYYQNSEAFNSKYNTKTAAILSALFFVRMYTKYKPVQEIIYGSNPCSLNPIRLYQHQDTSITPHPCNRACNNEEFSDVGNWWISEEYDPHDHN